MKNHSFNLESLLTLSPARLQLFLLASGVSLSVQECSQLQQVAKLHKGTLQSLPLLYKETEQVLGKKKMKELLNKSSLFL
ncbi:hypothetical protein [Jeotgalibacillus terrae]|uniref:Uncharacterized protein n=1 Tax=Jeotgalibacillus terrae TaxID=587735 RepID=A0ABW5ZJP0_9BACL|nr:hypothetical protein [Jeotgalibacillus terrae]MBM7577609.1 hypothetical protein [Jeotgalibacillus terrae]